MDFGEILAHHILDHRLKLLFTIGHFSFYLTYQVVMMWIASALLVLLLWGARRSKGEVPTGWANVVESLVVFVRDDVVRPVMGPAGDPYLPYFLTLFFFLVICNLLGLVPGASTPTGNVAVTGALALATLVLIQIAGIRQQGLWHYLKSLVPHGLPFVLVPLMFVIEVLGFITKSFALCIRLFANMIAGHIVILSLLCLIFIFRNVLVAAVSVPAAVGMALLEIFIAFLQAYIFVLLSAVFVGMAVTPQH